MKEMELSIGIAKHVLLKEVEKSRDKNIVLSPISLNLILNMVAAGAKGRTLEHMLEFLGSKNITDIKSKSLEMMEVVRSGSDDGEHEDGPILAMVSGVWVDKRFPLKPCHEKVLKRIFHCEAKNVDFITEMDKVAREANLWAKAASRGLITNILNSESLSSATTLVLANGFYFKGMVNKFVAKSTKNRDFYVLNGETISIPFMTSSEKYHYRSFDGFKVLKIPYQNDEQVLKRPFSMYQSGKLLKRCFSMYLFLPDKQDGLPNLLKKLNSKSGLLQKNLKLSQVKIEELWVPKFKISYNFDVCKAMQDMGLSFAFMNDSADFTKMVDVPKGLPLSISNMFQKTFIEIDEEEEGTEATTFSIHHMAPKDALFESENLSFVADHPFMFMIKEESSRFIFLTGAVLNPTES